MVIVGVLILSGAVNTSMIGANGVLNRVAEDGVLPIGSASRTQRYGTTYRLINLIALLQIATIVGQPGRCADLLGEAYAFGVVWSFFMKALGVMALRFQRHDQEYKIPVNLHIGGRELPIGLGMTTLDAVLRRHRQPVFEAGRHHLRRRIHARSFSSFSPISERINMRRKAQEKKGLEQFNLDHRRRSTRTAIHARPGSVLVAVRDYNRMDHLKRVLEKTNLRRHDIVVMTVRPSRPAPANTTSPKTRSSADYEKELFSHVVEWRRRKGRRWNSWWSPA